MKQFFYKTTQIKPSETAGALISFIFIFLLMASFMILKPVRDALPSDWGDVSLAQQWTITFVVSTIAVAIYNFFASKISLNKLVPSVFVLFAISFLAIFALSKFGCNRDILGKVFYVWSSVFSLFHISVFWSYTSQNYNKEESKRIFSFINTGASAGSIAGPLLVILLVKNVPLEQVLLITSGCLLSVLPLIVFLNRIHQKSSKENRQDLNTLSSNPLEGFKVLFTNSQLKRIALFILLFTGISAFLYTARNDLLVNFSSERRLELISAQELAINILTIVLGLVASNRLTQKFGLGTALAIVPFGISLLLILLSFNPAVMLVLALEVIRRAGNYSITRPAREILFTGVSREARFKTKPIIDVAIYRGGDVFWIWSLAYLGDGYLNFSLTQKLIVGAVIALIWGFVGLSLGRRHESKENQAP